MTYLRHEWSFDKKDVLAFCWHREVASKIGTANEASLKVFMTYLRDEWSFDKKDVFAFCFHHGVASKIGTADDASLKVFMTYLRDVRGFFDKTIFSISDITEFKEFRQFLVYMRLRNDRGPHKLLVREIARNGCEAFIHFYYMIKFQAAVRGAIARARVLPAMLSVDPTDLHNSVLFCVNGCK
jgi:hypothetical protein